MNRKIRPHIHVYPEIPDGPISEAWHGEKWRKGLDVSALSPMYDAGERHYYVGEVSRLVSGELVIPIRWIVYNGRVHADVHTVFMSDEVSTLHHPNRIPCMSSRLNTHDLLIGRSNN